MYITETIKYAGVNDHEITLFERQYPVPNGMSYNSYVILDEKITVMDTVDVHFTDKWLENIEEVCNGSSPAFLVVQHMEPDHSASICKFMEHYPDATIIAGAKAFVMLGQFYGTTYESRRIVVKEGDTVSLGKHILSFLEAPMVHWPEVIMTYEKESETLFCADAFGKFGALDIEDDWVTEARRYYAGIVGKYGTQVNNVLNKAVNLSLQRLCPLHGPVLHENLNHYLKLYQTWANYLPESNGILIAYTSMYGNTERAVMLLADMLSHTKAAPTPEIILRDLTKCDISEVVSDSFRFGTLVFATTSYNGGIFPKMRELLTYLTERNLQNRQIALIENGSWGPVAAKIMKGMLEKQKNITFIEPVVTINSALSEKSRGQLITLAEILKESIT